MTDRVAELQSRLEQYEKDVPTNQVLKAKLEAVKLDLTNQIENVLKEIDNKLSPQHLTLSYVY